MTNLSVKKTQGQSLIGSGFPPLVMGDKIMMFFSTEDIVALIRSPLAALKREGIGLLSRGDVLHQPPSGALSSATAAFQQPRESERGGGGAGDRGPQGTRRRLSGPSPLAGLLPREASVSPPPPPPPPPPAPGGAQRGTVPPAGRALF